MSAVAKLNSKLSHFLVKHNDMKEYVGVEGGWELSGHLTLSGRFWNRGTFLTTV